MIRRDDGRRLGPTGIAVVALAVLGFAVQAAPGVAEKPKKVATTATKLIVDADSVSGSVLSKRAECKKGRKVKLRSTATGKAALGTTKTDAKGRWLINISLGAGTFFADVSSARRGKPNGAEVQCRAVKSAPVTL